MGPVLKLSNPRPRDKWPQVAPRRLSILEEAEEKFDRPLGCLENNLVGEALAHEARVKKALPAGDPERMGMKEARGHLKRIRDNMFPGIAQGRAG